MNPYEDIINLPHPTSPKHPRMSAVGRAAQFSPFAALSGYEAALHETERLTDQKIELDESAKLALDKKLWLLADAIGEQPKVSITYFLPDKRKSGGEYITDVGRIKKIDEYERVVVLINSKKIPIDDIMNVESPLFREIVD